MHNTVGVKFLPGFKNEPLIEGNVMVPSTAHFREEARSGKTADRVVEVTPPTFRDPGVDLVGFFDDKARWSISTFGDDIPMEGVIRHLRKELDEVERDPKDLEEWVDVIFLAMDGAQRSGFSGKALVVKMIEKHQKNLRREWKRQSEGHYEHERRFDRTYELRVGDATFGPFSNFRSAADLAVKMSIAGWSKRKPGELEWKMEIGSIVSPAQEERESER